MFASGFSRVVRLVSGLALSVTMLASGCAGIHTVPKDRAAADLKCPAEQVQVTTAFKEQHAEGCKRSVDYAWACTDDGENCEWVQKGAKVVEVSKPAPSSRLAASGAAKK